MKKNKWKITASIELVVIMLLLVIWHSLATIHYDDICTITNNSEKYKLLIRSENPPILFGPEKIEILLYCNDIDKPAYLMSKSVSNDGKTLTKKNFLVEWKDDSFKLQIVCEEDFDITYTFYYDELFV